MEHQEEFMIKLVMDALKSHLHDLRDDFRRDLEKLECNMKDLVKDKIDLVRDDVKQHEERSEKRAMEHEIKAQHRFHMLEKKHKVEEQGPNP